MSETGQKIIMIKIIIKEARIKHVHICDESRADLVREGSNEGVVTIGGENDHQGRGTLNLHSKRS